MDDKNIFLKLFLIIFALCFLYWLNFGSNYVVQANPASSPVCKNLLITNVTKNTSCTSSNPESCKVAKGDRVKFSIQSDNANYYNFMVLKEYSDSKLFFKSDLYSEMKEITETIDDTKGLIRYEVRGYVRRLDGTDASNVNNNSSESCRVVFNLPDSGSNVLNDTTPSCVATDIKILTKNNYVCRRNSGDCPVSKGDEIELTVESSKSGSNIIGYLVDKVYKDGRVLMVEDYNTNVNGSRYSFRYKIDNDPELKELKVLGLVGYNIGPNNFEKVSNSFSCVSSFNFSNQGTNDNNNSIQDITDSNQQNSNLYKANNNLFITLNSDTSKLFNNNDNKLTGKDLLFELQIENNGDNELSINDLDLNINYDKNLLTLKKIVLKKGEEQVEINNLTSNNLSDLKDLINDLNLKKLESSQKYNVLYYFEVSKPASDNKYCVDFFSENFKQNLNKCIELVPSKINLDNNILLYVYALGSIILLISGGVLFIYRNKIKSFVQNIIQKQKS